jgi:hypothetical protein
MHREPGAKGRSALVPTEESAAAPSSRKASRLRRDGLSILNRVASCHSDSHACPMSRKEPTSTCPRNREKYRCQNGCEAGSPAPRQQLPAPMPLMVRAASRQKSTLGGARDPPPNAKCVRIVLCPPEPRGAACAGKSAQGREVEGTRDPSLTLVGPPKGALVEEHRARPRGGEGSSQGLSRARPLRVFYGHWNARPGGCPHHSPDEAQQSTT